MTSSDEFANGGAGEPGPAGGQASGGIGEPRPDDAALDGPTQDDAVAGGAAPQAVAPESGTLEMSVLEVELLEARAEAAERTADLQRLQAEYVNYRKRVDRDRALARELAIGEVVESLISVLDDTDLARQHGELTGPFAAVAEKLESTLAKFGAKRYGEAGEVFDPMVHEALMHSSSPEATETVVAQVLQPGYLVGERVLRPARVAVIGPQ